MQYELTNKTASISQIKANPMRAIKESKGEIIAVKKLGKIVFYVVPCLATCNKIIQNVVTHITASLTEFKISPLRLLESSGSEAIAISNRSSNAFYIVLPCRLEELIEEIEDEILTQQAGKVLRDIEAGKTQLISVNIDEL